VRNVSLILVLGRYFEPIAGLLALMAANQDKGDRRQQGGVLIQKIVTAAAAICGPVGNGLIRANYFELRDGQLHFVTHHGRGEAPRSQLPQEALSLAMARKHALVPDVREVPNPASFAGVSYRTSLSSSVFSGETVHGLLTVDATGLGMLSKRDLRTAVALSHMLGAGLAMQKK